MKNKIKILLTVLGLFGSFFAVASDLPIAKRDSLQQLLEQRIIELGKNKTAQVMAQNAINDQRHESYKNNYIIDFSFIDTDVLVVDYFKALTTSPTPTVTCGQPSSFSPSEITTINQALINKNDLIPSDKPKIYFGVNFNTGPFTYDTKVVSISTFSDYGNVGTERQKKGVNDILTKFNQIVGAITPSTGLAVMISMGFYCRLELYGKNYYPSLGGILTYSYKTPEPDQTTKNNVARIFRESQLQDYPKDKTQAASQIIGIAENFKKALMGQLYNIPDGMGKDFFDQYMRGYSQFSKELKDIALLLNELGATGYGGYVKNANVVQEITAESLAKFKKQLEAYKKLLVAARAKIGSSTTAAEIDEIVTKLARIEIDGLSREERIKCIRLLSAFPDAYTQEMLIIKTDYYATYGGGNSLAIPNMMRKVSFFNNIVKIINSTPVDQVVDIIAALQGNDNDILKKIIAYDSDSMPFNLALVSLLERSPDFEARKIASGVGDRLFIFHNLDVFNGEQNDQVGAFSIDIKFENGKVKYKRQVADKVGYLIKHSNSHEAPEQHVEGVIWKQLDANYIEVDPLEMVALVDRTYLPIFSNDRKDASYYTNNSDKKVNVVPAIFLWYFFEKQKDDLFWKRVEFAGNIVFLVASIPTAPLSIAALAIQSPKFTSSILWAYRSYVMGSQMIAAGSIATYIGGSDTFKNQYSSIIDKLNLAAGLTGVGDLALQAYGARFLNSYSSIKAALVTVAESGGTDASAAKRIIDFAETFRAETGAYMKNSKWYETFVDNAAQVGGTLKIKAAYESTFNWLKAIGKVEEVTPSANYAIKFRNQTIARVVKEGTEGIIQVEPTAIVNSSEAAAIAAIPEATYIVKSGGADMNPIINCRANGTCGFGFPGCFEGKSLVYTRNGYKAIMDVDTSDYVLAFNEATKEEKFEKISTTYKRTSNKLIKIYVKGDTIQATPEHPFYVDNKWVFAGNLKKGDKLTFSKDYNPEIIASTDKMPYLARSDIDSIATEDVIGFVYNLEVANSSTFFVGKNKILVHNECEIERTLRSFLPEVAETNAVDNVGKLRKALKELTNAVNVFGNSTTSVTLQSKIRALGEANFKAFLDDLTKGTLKDNLANLTPEHIDAWSLLKRLNLSNEKLQEFSVLDFTKKLTTDPKFVTFGFNEDFLVRYITNIRNIGYKAGLVNSSYEEALKILHNVFKELDVTKIKGGAPELEALFGSSGLANAGGDTKAHAFAILKWMEDDINLAGNSVLKNASEIEFETEITKLINSESNTAVADVIVKTGPSKIVLTVFDAKVTQAGFGTKEAKQFVVYLKHKTTVKGVRFSYWEGSMTINGAQKQYTRPSLNVVVDKLSREGHLNDSEVRSIFGTYAFNVGDIPTNTPFSSASTLETYLKNHTNWYDEIFNNTFK